MVTKLPRDATIEQIIEGAKQGDAGAQVYLANCYRTGERVGVQDLGLAFSWAKKSAEQGLPMAQAMLGSFYREGTGTARDLTQAFKWFMKAAEQGDANAQLCVAMSYKDGDGTTQDFAQAVSWFKKAAANGHPIALKIVTDHNM